jgi:hypothetical protein
MLTSGAVTGRTTLAAAPEDLETLRAEARRRRVSLARLLREMVAQRAKQLRERRRPRIVVGRSGKGVARDSVRDEVSPAVSRYKS